MDDGEALQVDLVPVFQVPSEWVVDASPQHQAMRAAHKNMVANAEIIVGESGFDFDGFLDSIIPDAIIFAGKSMHFGGDGKYSDGQNLYDLNEENLGVSAIWKLSQSDQSQAFLEVGSYKNSQHNQSNYVAVGYEHDLFDSKKVGVGIKAGLISGYEDYVSGNLIVAGNFIPAISPYVRFGKDSQVHADISLMPAPGSNFEFEDEDYNGSRLVTHVTVTVPL